MSHPMSYPVGFPTELPTLSNLGLPSMLNKEPSMSSFNAPERHSQPHDLYARPHEPYSAATPAYPGRTRYEENRYPREPVPEYAEPVPKRAKVENYFEEAVRRPISPYQIPFKQPESRVYETQDNRNIGPRPPRFRPDAYEREFPSASPSIARHSYDRGLETNEFERYSYPDTELVSHRSRMPPEYVGREMPRRRSSHEVHSSLPTYPSSYGYSRSTENEDNNMYENRGYRPYLERDHVRKSEVYDAPHSSEYWSHADSRACRSPPSRKVSPNSGLEKVVENCRMLHQFATDYGYSTHHNHLSSLPPDHLLKQMTNYTYDILQVLMSLRSESLRTDPEPEMDRDDSDVELSKLEDEDMKYIRDKRSLLSNSRSKYQKRTRNGSSQPRRCHACNTTETPEWRRGPDGARTLCNACGLHYAKLTRKRTLAAAGSSDDKEDQSSAA